MLVSTRSEIFGRWLAAASLGLFLLLLTFYALWALGFLDQAVGMIISSVASSDSITIRVVCPRSDLFWSTSVDTVVVLTHDGVRVVVSDVDIDGSAVSYLAGRGLRRLRAGEVVVEVPLRDSTGPSGTLPEVLASVEDGIVTTVDSLLVEAGRVRVHGVDVADSIFLATGLIVDNGAVLRIDSLSAVVPRAGRVTANGHLRLANCVLSSEGFSAASTAGGVELHGEMDGIGRLLQAEGSGWLSLVPLLPFASGVVRFETTTHGSLDRPELVMSLLTENLRLFGREVRADLDSLHLGLDSVRVFEGHFESGSVAGSFSGRLSFGDGWFARADLALAGFDPASELGADLPGMRLTGRASVSASGSLLGPGSLWFDCDLASVTMVDDELGRVRASGEVSAGAWSLDASATGTYGRVSYRGSGEMGADWLPAAHSGRLELALSSLPAALGRLRGVGELPQASGISGGLDVSGSRRALRLSGSLAMSDMGYGGLAASDVALEGAMSVGPGVTSGRASLEIGSLSSPIGELQLRTTMTAAWPSIEVESLELSTAGGICASASGRVELAGESGSVRMNGLALSMSKLRLVSDGLVSLVAGPESIVLDSLWLQTPHGQILASLRSGPGDTLALALRLSDLDLASASSASGLLHGISGIGSIELTAVRQGPELLASLDGLIRSPSYGPFSSDSITLSAFLTNDSLAIEGVYSWREGRRSGLRASLDSPWSGESPGLRRGSLRFIELEVEEPLDWVLSLLPTGLRTRGGYLSAHLEYERIGPDADPVVDAEISARADELYLTSMGIVVPNVLITVQHSDPAEATFTTQFSLTALDVLGGSLGVSGSLEFTDYLPDPRIGSYSFTGRASSINIGIPNLASLVVEGKFSCSGHSSSKRPLVSGAIQVSEGLVTIPDMGSEGASTPDLPVELDVSIGASRGLWFRSSFADIELNADLRVVTNQHRPAVLGTINAVRGRMFLLQKEFQIIEGSIQFFGLVPIRPYVTAIAETRIIGAMDRETYVIMALVQGYLDNLEMTLSGTGPAGDLLQEDIITLLALGITYDQLQQLDTGALESELESIAQSYVGQLLARSIREGIGLDQLVLDPELMGEQEDRSLTVNIGKYVLPDLFLSYEGDVLSSEPGTIRAQYFLTRDFSVIGSTRSSLHGEMEPSLELHYTFRY
ncbi:translocation/assembly module TamB domain-containing protein [Candidatus Fermentibacterales bacterium]|nr:translocation/assembly module TamB domain-containing protein [Candidatus Fermentibacterales bacterium]